MDFYLTTSASTFPRIKITWPNGEIISYKMCAVKVRNAKLRNYLKRQSHCFNTTYNNTFLSFHAESHNPAFTREHDVSKSATEAEENDTRCGG
jgi:hypothetical protein